MKIRAQAKTVRQELLICSSFVSFLQPTTLNEIRIHILLSSDRKSSLTLCLFKILLWCTGLSYHFNTSLLLKTTSVTLRSQVILLLSYKSHFTVCTPYNNIHYSLSLFSIQISTDHWMSMLLTLGWNRKEQRLARVAIGKAGILPGIHCWKFHAGRWNGFFPPLNTQILNKMQTLIKVS